MSGASREKRLYGRSLRRMLVAVKCGAAILPETTSRLRSIKTGRRALQPFSFQNLRASGANAPRLALKLWPIRWVARLIFTFLRLMFVHSLSIKIFYYSRNSLVLEHRAFNLSWNWLAVKQITLVTESIPPPPMKNRSGTNASFKNRSSESVYLKKKTDQLLFSYIAVDRFFKSTLSLDWFLKNAPLLDRFFIGGIGVIFTRYIRITLILKYTLRISKENLPLSNKIQATFPYELYTTTCSQVIVGVT